MTMWYVRVRGQQLGPFSTEELGRWRQQGRVQGFHEASTDGVNWRAIDLIPTFRPATTIPDTPQVTAQVLASPSPAGGLLESQYQAILATSVGVVLLGGVVLGYLILKPGSTPQEVSRGATPLSGEQINKRLLPSTVFIVKAETTSAGTRMSVGSGVLVHGQRRLVMTNFHVVGDRGTVMVYFPAYQRGELVTDPQYYAQNRDQLGFVGTVRAGSARKDLAILELDRLPIGAVAVPLASQPAETGSKVYSIGASGIEFEKQLAGTLWRLSTGEVRARSERTTRYDNQQLVSAMMLETQKPINKGDSGGPTVNEFGALVGVVSASDPLRDAVKFDIDLTEVRQFVQDFATQGQFKWDGPTAEGHPAIR